MTLFLYDWFIIGRNFYQVTLPFFIILNVSFFSLQLILCSFIKRLGIRLIPFYLLAFATIETIVFILNIIVQGEKNIWIFHISQAYMWTFIPVWLSVGIAWILGSIISALKKRKLTRKN